MGSDHEVEVSVRRTRLGPQVAPATPDSAPLDFSDGGCDAPLPLDLTDEWTPLSDMGGTVLSDVSTDTLPVLEYHLRLCRAVGARNGDAVIELKEKEVSLPQVIVGLVEHGQLGWLRKHYPDTLTHALDSQGYTVYHWAASRSVECLRALLKDDRSILSVATPSGVDPLIASIVDDNYDTFRILWKITALRYHADTSGCYAFHYAARLNRSTMLNVMVRDMDIFAFDDRFGRNALHFAAHIGATQTLEILCRAARNEDGLLEVSWPDYFGFTPFDYAIQYAQIECADLLSDGGYIEPEGRTHTSLCIALESGRAKSLHWMISKYATATENGLTLDRDFTGHTVWLAAVKREDVLPLFDSFYGYRMDPWLEEGNGELAADALGFAFQKGLQEVLEWYRSENPERFDEFAFPQIRLFLCGGRSTDFRKALQIVDLVFQELEEPEKVLWLITNHENAISYEMMKGLMAQYSMAYITLTQNQHVLMNLLLDNLPDDEQSFSDLLVSCGFRVSQIQSLVELIRLTPPRVTARVRRDLRAIGVLSPESIRCWKEERQSEFRTRFKDPEMAHPTLLYIVYELGRSHIGKRLDLLWHAQEEHELINMTELAEETRPARPRCQTPAKLKGVRLDDVDRMSTGIPGPSSASSVTKREKHPEQHSTLTRSCRRKAETFHELITRVLAKRKQSRQYLAPPEVFASLRSVRTGHTHY